ncbi:MAG: type I-B CRISPR-associated protein Cas5b [Promethearchaeota archaeon]
MAKILIFDIESELGLFKKFYTTASLLTFDFPPKTALIGLLGAILGYSRKSEKLLKLQSIQVGIQILNPIQKMHQGVNWLNTKVRGVSSIQDSTRKQLSDIMEKSSNDAYGFVGDMQYKPTNIQLLIEPKYRIYVKDNLPNVFNKLNEAIKNQEYVYSPYLGQTEYIAKITFVDLVEFKEKQIKDPLNMIPIHTVFPDSQIIKDRNGNNAIKISDSKIILETLPLEYEKDNTKFVKMIYNKECNPLHVAVKKYFEISSKMINNGDPLNIIFF